MENVTSADGTKIAFEISGNGPPLILVHGASASSARWGKVRPLLEAHFTVVAVDRRGRGESGDGSGPYAIEAEYADVAAVVEAMAEPVILFGHSYGGVTALGATELTDLIAALIIYEAPVEAKGDTPIKVLDRLDETLDEGDREGVLKIFCEEIVRMRPGDIAALRASPAWPARVAAAHTIGRELRVIEGFDPGKLPLEKISIPTLLLHGADSPDFLVNSMHKLASLMPYAKQVALEGQQHVAMDTAPQMLTDAVVEFWRDTGGSPIN
ncbi:MAG: alpha/beta fold hydrolase [Rhizobiaceae bacterium]